MPQKLLIATHNAGKVEELRALLVGIPLEAVGLEIFPNVEEVAETGCTFAENARLKAVGYARQTGITALADDSGLEVEALGGRPGVLSARYRGAATAFSEKINLLLDELAQIADGERQARFVCSIALAEPGGEVLFTADGVCPGQIARVPRGNNGFGYDPVFIPDGFDQTFGELPGSLKREIGHRGLAFLQIMPFLRDFSRD